MFDVRNVIIDGIMIFLSIVNVYCIGLQRVNYLRMEVHCYKYYRRYFAKLSLCKEELMKNICIWMPRDIQDDYALICRLRDAYLGKGDCVLGGSDIESMERIYRCVEAFLPKSSVVRKRKVSETRLLDKCNVVSGPYTVLQRRVNGLQEFLGMTRRKMLEQTSVVTEDAGCEALYKRLVSGDTTVGMEFVCYLLYELYSEVVVEMKADGV